MRSRRIAVPAKGAAATMTLVLSVALLAPIGCQSSSPAASNDLSSQATQPANPAASETRTAQMNEVAEVAPLHPIFSGDRDADEDQADASPSERYEHELVEKALTGLDFDKGVVEIDRSAGRQVANIGNPQAAAAKYAQAEDLLYNQNQSIQALAAYTDAIFIDPSNAAPYEGLGRALSIQGEIPEAEVALLTAINMDPHSARAMFDLGALYYSNGKYDAGISAYRRAIALDPNYGDVHERLACALYYGGQYANAWHEVHEAQRCGTPVPPQMLPLLSAKARDTGR